MHKLFFILLITLSISKATTYELTYRLGANLVEKAPNGNTGIAISYEEGEDSRQDWIAIYKKGDSNDWDNVISWSWVDDLDGLAPADTSHYFLNPNLEFGDYEFRFFKHNSYDVEHTESFKVSPNMEIANMSIKSKNNLWLILKSSYVDDDTWIGIYKKGDSNDWNNVIDWAWIKDDETWFRMSGYENGTYEARLFYHNSYNIEKKVEFTIEGNPEEEKFINIISQNPIEIKIKHGRNVTKMSWIAIFKEGAESKAENVLAWRYLNTYMCCPDYRYETTLNIKDLEVGKYDLRLFNNNSYNIEAQTTLEIKEENLYNQKIFKSALASKFGPKKIQLTHIIFRKKDYDWVGMFKIGSDYNIDNLIAWSYIQDDNKEYTHLDIIKHVQIKDNEKFQFVYFAQDSYKVLKEEQLTVKVDKNFQQF